MNIKVYYILHHDIFGSCTLTFEGDSVTLENVADILNKAKTKFDLPGKLYTVLADGKVFHVGKVGKIWKAYELKESNYE